MKNIKFMYLKTALLFAFIAAVTISCERDMSDDVEFATYQTTPEIFIDGFVGGLDYFPFGNSFAEAFSVDKDVKYAGTASMRFDIPVFGVGYGGATFPSTGPRDLSSYDALTFWAKASQGADINEIGFGINGDTKNKYQVTLRKLPLTTQWKKYVIAIPDPSKLFQEKGMFWYAEGAGNASEEGGYTFWIDELKFEKLGTIAQPQPAILGGLNVVQQTFIDTNIELDGLTQTFNLASGTNQTLSIAPSYFTFTSSDIEVARVSELGVVSVVGSGTATISASLGGVKAKGSLTIESTGALAIAPIPMVPSADVKSIYSDTYVSVTESNFDPKFGGSTTQTIEAGSVGSFVQIYTNNNYTGIIFNNTVDASTLTHLHVDIYVEKSDTNIEIQIRDIGANGELETNVFTGLPEGDDKDYRFTASSLTVGSWTSFDIPLSGGLATQKDNLGALILVGGPDFILDNIYFYKE